MGYVGKRERLERHEEATLAHYHARQRYLNSPEMASKARQIDEHDAQLDYRD